MKKAFSIAILSLLFPAVLFSQSARDKAAQEVTKQKEQMMAMGVIPGEVAIELGQDAFNNEKGPNGKTCASCHGKDAEKIADSYRYMPKYYADGKKVMDIDLRVKTCMEKNTGVEKVDQKKSSFMNLVVYIASKSNGKTIKTKASHPDEIKAYKYGEELWFQRVGKLDLSCAMCHQVYGGKQIRYQGLARVKEDASSAHWPAYRFSKDANYSMEGRIKGCYDAMQVPKPKSYSKEIIALNLYMKQQARAGFFGGAKIQVPGFLR